MDIEALRFSASEDDINQLFARFVAPPPKVRDLRLRVVQDRLSVVGVYRTVIPIPFESLWEISVFDGKIAARLSGIKTGGMKTNFLKDYVLNVIASKIRMLELRDQTFALDLDRLLIEVGVPLQTHLVSVRCHPGRVVIECGLYEAKTRYA